MLTIADAEDAVGLAGVMGGASTEMHDGTTSVFLESASFDPVNTRRTAAALRINTEASHRFERGIRAELAPLALRRATQLILEIAGGEDGTGDDMMVPFTDDVVPEIDVKGGRMIIIPPVYVEADGPGGEENR